MKNLIALAMVATLMACGGSSAPADTLYDDGDQNAPLCPIPATYQGAPGVEGDPCTNAAADCAPSCCQCSGASSDDSYWASECAGGSCTSGSQACNDAPSSTLCN